MLSLERVQNCIRERLDGLLVVVQLRIDRLLFGNDQQEHDANQGTPSDG